MRWLPAGPMDGLAAPLRGFLILARTKALWPYAALPTLLGLVWGALVLVQVLAVPAGGGWLLAVLGFILKWALAASILMIQLLIVLCAPLLDWLSERTEEAIGALPRGESFWRELFSLRFLIRSVRAVVEAVKLLGFKLGVALVAAVVGFFPLIGPVAAALLYGVVTGIDFLDYPLARRDWVLRRKLAWAKQNAPGVLAYGVAVFLLLSIPGVGGILLAPCVVGGSDLVFRLGITPRR